MRVALFDLRTQSASIGSDLPALLIVGHGTRQSVGGYTSQTFPIIASAQVIWIYACNCGKQLIKDIAERHGSATVFGYTTNVLAPITGPIESTVAGDIKRFLEEYTGAVDPIQILEHIQNKLLLEAIFQMERARTQHDGVLIMTAALINHTRLSLRFAKQSS
jgi:hypothetical protein